MAGTKQGGMLAAKKNKKRYGKDFYAKIGAEGGKRGHTGGFYANREMARAAGALGGLISRRSSAKLTPKQRDKIRRDKEVQQAFAHLQAVQEKARNKHSLLAPSTSSVS